MPTHNPLPETVGGRSARVRNAQVVADVIPPPRTALIDAGFTEEGLRPTYWYDRSRVRGSKVPHSPSNHMMPDVLLTIPELRLCSRVRSMVVGSSGAYPSRAGIVRMSQAMIEWLCEKTSLRLALRRSFKCRA